MKTVIEIDDKTIKYNGETYTKDKPNGYGDMVFDVPAGEKYYFVVSGGIDYYRNSGSNLDKDTIPLGVFLTREAAERELAKQKAFAKLRQSEGARRFVRGEDNWSAYYDYRNKSVETEENYYFENQGSVFFDTEENCRKAHTPEIVEAIWGVK